MSKYRGLPYSRIRVHALIVLIGLAVMLYGDRIVSNQLAERDHHHVELAASQLTMGVHLAMDNKIAAVMAVQAFYQHSDQPLDEKVNGFIDAALSNEPSFKFLMSVNTDYVVRGVYPRQWEKTLLGARVGEYSYELVEKAKESRKVVISRPLSLPEGGDGFLLFAPIFVGDDFHGLVVGFFDREQMLAECIPGQFQKSFALYVCDEEGGTICGSPVKAVGISSAGVIRFANSVSRWEYVIVPTLRQRTQEIFMSRLPMWAFGVVLLLSLNYFIHLNYRRRKELEELVSERTEELRAANKALEQLAIKDPLTGLYNRRYFFDRFEEELSRAKRAGLPMSVLLLDLDDFKRVNDTHGHLVGDSLLAQTANVLRKNVRKEDVVARYGGEEFVLLLVGADKETAAHIAERIRQDIETALSTHVPQSAETVKVTASIGVAEFYSPMSKDIKGDDIIVQADVALYEAKRAGKNAISVFSP